MIFWIFLPCIRFAVCIYIYIYRHPYSNVLHQSPADLPLPTRAYFDTNCFFLLDSWMLTITVHKVRDKEKWYIYILYNILTVASYFHIVLRPMGKETYCCPLRLSGISLHLQRVFAIWHKDTYCVDISNHISTGDIKGFAVATIMNGGHGP